MSDDDAGHGRGRPQKFPGEGARISHSLRLKPAVAERLRIAAQAANRTLGEEMELRINQSFVEEENISNIINTAVDTQTLRLRQQLNAAETKNRYDNYFARLKFATEKRYCLILERIVFEHQIRVHTRLFSFFGSRFQKFASFGKDTASEKIFSIDMRVKEQDIEIEECNRQIAIIREEMEEEIVKIRAYTEAEKLRIADAERRIANAKKFVSSYTTEVDDTAPLPDLTAEPHPSAPTRSGRAAGRR